jgi:hypothetical protein
MHCRDNTKNLGANLKQQVAAVPGCIDFFLFCRMVAGRNAKAWWNPKGSRERYDYYYEIKKMAVSAAAGTSGVEKAFAFLNNHVPSQRGGKRHYPVSGTRSEAERNASRSDGRQILRNGTRNRSQHIDA